MKANTVFTSTISPQLIAWIDERARKDKKTRRAILEEAIVRYQKDVRREALREGFSRAARDPDMLELSEWGMDDYAGMVRRA